MENLFTPAKTVELKLSGLDGNAFVLMGAFSAQAKKEGWKEEEIQKVLTEAKKSDYQHLLRTLFEHCSSNEDDEEIDEDD